MSSSCNRQQTQKKTIAATTGTTFDPAKNEQVLADLMGVDEPEDTKESEEEDTCSPWLPQATSNYYIQQVEGGGGGHHGQSYSKFHPFI